MYASIGEYMDNLFAIIHFRNTILFQLCFLNDISLSQKVEVGVALFLLLLLAVNFEVLWEESFIICYALCFNS